MNTLFKKVRATIKRSSKSQTCAISDIPIPENLIETLKTALPVIEQTLSMELPPVVVDVCIQQLSRVPTLLEKLVSSDIASESEDLLETETFFEDTLLSEQKQASVSHILLEDTSLLEPELALKTKALHQARVTPEEKTPEHEYETFHEARAVLEDKVSELEPDIFHEVKTIHEEESTASLAESTPKRMSHSKTIDRFARWIRRSLVKSIKPVVPNMDLLCEENGQPMSIEQAIDLLIHENPNDITVLKKSVTISKELVMEPNELVRDDKGSLPSLISSGIKTEESGLSLAQSSDSNDSNDQHSIELLSTALSSSKGGKKRSVSRLFGMRSRDKYFTSFQDIKKPSKRNVPILLGNIGRKMRKTFSRKEIKATLDHLEGLLEPQALEIEIPEPETPELEAPEPETPEPETPEPETPEEAALDPDTLIGVELIDSAIQVNEDSIPELIEHFESMTSENSHHSISIHTGEEKISLNPRQDIGLPKDFTVDIEAKIHQVEEFIQSWLERTRQNFMASKKKTQLSSVSSIDKSMDTSLDSLLRASKEHHILKTALFKLKDQKSPKNLEIRLVTLFPTIFRKNYYEIENSSIVLELQRSIGELDYAAQWLSFSSQWDTLLFIENGVYLFEKRLDIFPEWTLPTLFHMGDYRQDLMHRLSLHVCEPMPTTVNEDIFSLLEHIQIMEAEEPDIKELKMHYEEAIRMCEELAEMYILCGYEYGMLDVTSRGYVFEETHSYLPEWNLKTMRTLSSTRAFMIKKLNHVCQQIRSRPSDSSSINSSVEGEMDLIRAAYHSNDHMSSLVDTGIQWSPFGAGAAFKHSENVSGLIPTQVAQSVLDSDSASSLFQNVSFINIRDKQAYLKHISTGEYELKWQQQFRIEYSSREKMASVLECISRSIQEIMRTNHSKESFSHSPAFSYHPQMANEGHIGDVDFFGTAPFTNWQQIYNHMAFVMSCAEIHSEHLVITYIYITRMLATSDQKICEINWRMIVMSALLLSVKVWDDYAIYNSDFAQIYPDMTLEKINHAEKVFLYSMKYCVDIKCTDFALIYFNLLETNPTL